MTHVRLTVVPALLIGAVVGAAAALGGSIVFAAKKPAAPLDFSGDKKAVAERLLVEAERLAGSGSWERIGVGRVRYLMGDKAGGERLFNSVAKPVPSDLRRIAATYAAAGEWAKAKEYYERAHKEKPGDGGIAVEAGAWCNLKGDRARAEELFTKAFTEDREDFWNHVIAAGSYVGVEPF
ncbi:MAG TPA: tetratricopeptide repeat protein [Candidatus Polarisedimenticolia bacterium]|nr:tetratricopeptide repeat protein [Candidatus Polarisedimenticolia bacterium]